MYMCKFPNWKPDQKQKWTVPKGFDNHGGCPASHVVKIRHPGNGKEDMAQTSVNNKSVWKVCQNENEPGQDPFTYTNPQMLENTMQRQRNIHKE